MIHLPEVFQIRVPSKTFLIGEYAVLEGASALIVSTPPFFNFKIHTAKPSHPFHKKSPAGRYIEKHSKIFSSIQIELMEKRPSGFGLSGAEWNVVLEIHSLFKKEDLSIHQIWEEYRTFSDSTSGADVVAQRLGGLCHFCSSPFRAETLNWSFENLEFAFILTGESLETWKHLKDIKIKYLDSFKNISNLALKAVKEKDQTLFIQSIRDYAHELEKRNWLTQTTQTLLAQINSHSDILASKGCGALGAECVVFFFKKENKERIFSSLQKELSPLQSLREGTLSEGVQTIL